MVDWAALARAKPTPPPAPVVVPRDPPATPRAARVQVPVQQLRWGVARLRALYCHSPRTPQSPSWAWIEEIEAWLEKQ